MNRPAVIDELTPRQGKVLRQVVTTSVQPVPVSRCIHTMPWSDLPKNDMQARKVLNVLSKLGLVERADKGFYTATLVGKEVIKYANKEGLWRKAPPPSVTNRFFNTEKPKGKQ
jgi:hypothetical protein